MPPEGRMDETQVKRRIRSFPNSKGSCKEKDVEWLYKNGMLDELMKKTTVEQNAILDPMRKKLIKQHETKVNDSNKPDEKKTGTKKHGLVDELTDKKKEAKKVKTAGKKVDAMNLDDSEIEEVSLPLERAVKAHRSIAMNRFEKLLVKEEEPVGEDEIDKALVPVGTLKFDPNPQRMVFAKLTPDGLEWQVLHFSKDGHVLGRGKGYKKHEPWYGTFEEQECVNWLPFLDGTTTESEFIRKIWNVMESEDTLPWKNPDDYVNNPILGLIYEWITSKEDFAGFITDDKAHISETHFRLRSLHAVIGKVTELNVAAIARLHARITDDKETKRHVRTEDLAIADRTELVNLWSAIMVMIKHILRDRAQTFSEMAINKMTPNAAEALNLDQRTDAKGKVFYKAGGDPERIFRFIMQDKKKREPKPDQKRRDEYLKREFEDCSVGIA